MTVQVGTQRSGPERATPPQWPSAAARLRAQYGTLVSRVGYEPQSAWSVSLHVLWHITLILVSALLCAAAIARAPVTGWVAYPVVVFFIGTRFRALGNMIHEACHGMLVRGKRRNQSFGNLLAIIDYTDLRTYTQEHFTHHRHLGDAERDLDFRTRHKFGFAEAGGGFIRKHLLRPLLLIHLPTFVRPVLWSQNDPAWVRVGRLAFVATLLAVGHWVTGWSNLLLFYVVPYFVAYQVIRYWSDAVDHAQIIGSADEFQRSRNHVLPGTLLNRILFPRHDEYHLTHHLFPAVPTAFQPQVHELLMRDEEYSKRPHRFLEALPR